MRTTFFFLMLAVWVLINSCSKQIFSHEQVMQSYRTKEDVLRQFGQPDEIMALNDTTQWLYNCDTSSNFSATKTKVKINGIYNSVAGFNNSPASVKQFSQYERYVKFTFNKDSEVLNWNASGVNFAERRPKKLATTALVIGSVVGAATIMGYFIFINEFKNW